MPILVVADVHANIEAFRAVIADAESNGAIDTIWCLGDLVGYGPDPLACIDLLQAHDHIAVAGNHDLAASEAIGLRDFNTYAATAARWTRSVLDERHKAWLRGLPQVVIQDNFTLVHVSLVDPLWDYLLTPELAKTHLQAQTTPYGLVGHSHLRLAFFEDGGSAAGGTDLALDGRRFVANPGSVGQPRDGEPRAAYALLDPDRRLLSFHRVAYDVATTQAKIRSEGLPGYFADRLEPGR